MHSNRELLTAIHENAAVGKDTLGRLIRRSADGTMRAAMAEQFAEYHKLLIETEKRISSSDDFLKKRIPRAPIFASMWVNLSVDSTSTHMAEMIVQGGIMGIIEMKRQLRELPDADADIRELAERLIMTEAANIRSMYEYL